MSEERTRAVMPKEPWRVYVVLCSDGTFYTGISNDVPKRIQKHNSGAGAQYTKTRRPVILLAESCDLTKSQALRFERLVKRRPRDEKATRVQRLTSELG